METSSKKCPSCHQWSSWNQSLEDKCEHCGKPLAIQEIKVRDEINERDKKMEGYTIEVVKIHPDDNLFVVFIKKDHNRISTYIYGNNVFFNMAGSNISRLIPGEFKSRVFIASVCVFLVVEITKKAGLHIPYFHWYANDLISMPVFISCAQFLEKTITGNRTMEYDYKKIIQIFLIISITYEYVLPLKSTKYTSDIFDVICYGTGALVYYFDKYRKNKSLINSLNKI